MQISFLNPGFFVLLALIPVLWFVPRRIDRPLQGCLRSLLLALLVTALAQPLLLAPGSEDHRVVIVDRSASLSRAQHAEADEVLAELTGDTGTHSKLTVVELGASPRAGAELMGGQHLTISRNGSESSLSAALAAAAQQFPVGVSGRIALISDGLATDRDWGSTVGSLIERGVAVDVHDLGVRDDDVYPAAIYTAGESRVGDTVDVFVTVIGTGDVTVVLTDGDGEELARTETRVEERRDVALSFEPDTEGFMTLTAEVTAEHGDSNLQNNRVSAGLAVQQPVNVLYLAAPEQDGAAHLQHLLGPGFAVDTPEWPLDANLSLERYQLVMLDDLPARLLPDAFQQRLSTAVQEQGLGLLFAGGRGAFGEGGYFETPVAKVLPVEFQQRTEKKEPTVALAIIVDTSGSMKGRPVELAKQMARLSLNQLRQTDTVGVVEFYGNKNWAVPLQTLRSRAPVERAISRLQSGGGTTLLPGIEEAYYGLKNVRATYKHILVITDGDVEEADFDNTIRRMAREGITLSTVLSAVGEDSAILSRMARVGNGRFYAVPGSFNLVEIDFRKPDTTRLPAYKTGDYPVVARSGTGWWGEADTLDLPAISGYVEVQNRQGADVLLETDGSRHPLLSSWRYGLGRVTALMTEPVGPGTFGWQAWADYGRLLSRVMRRTATDGHDFDYQAIRQGDRLHVDAVRTAPGDTRPALSVAGGTHEGEALEGEALAFREMAPGWFRGSLPVPAADDVQLLSPAADFRLMANAAVSAETQVDPRRGLDLVRLAQATGGAVLSRGETVSDMPESAGSLSVWKLSPWLLLLMLLMYLSELLYRRWPAGA